MEEREQYLRELCLEVACGNVVGERFNDLLLKTEIELDDREWRATTRLLQESEEVGHLAALSSIQIH